MRWLALVLVGCGAPAMTALDGGALDGGADGAATVGVAFVPLRAPAVPIAVRDPYLNAWMVRDDPASDWPRHWNGTERPLVVAARLDGRAYRLVGAEPAAATLPLVSVEVRPSRSTYRFAARGVAIAVSFVTPLLPGDDEAMALPGVWIELSAAALDGQSHDLALYVDVDSSWARADQTGALAWSLVDLPTANGAAKRFSVAASPGNVYRDLGELPDWGELALAAPVDAGTTWRAGP